MNAPKNPSEIARETLRQLAQRRVPPTPDNYRKLYHEIAGTRTDNEVPPERFLRQLARRLPRDSAERLKTAREMDQALAADNPKAADDALNRYLEGLKSGDQPAWNDLISNLLRAWEGRQQGWTTARKRESLDRVLGASEPSTLHSRLQGLIRGWNQAPAVDDVPISQDSAGQSDARLPATTSAPAETTYPSPQQLATQAVAGHQELADGLRKLLLSMLRDVVPAMLGDHPELAEEVSQLAGAASNSLDPVRLEQIGGRLRRLAHRLEMITADDAEVRAGLLELLRLLLHNIDELVLDDKWLAGQIEMLRELVNAPPNPRTLDDAGRRLKDLIYKQSQLKHNLIETQRQLRAMLAGLVDQLARFSETTGTYHDRIGHCAQRIAEASDIGAIGPVLDEVMQETRSIQEEARRSHDELITTREQARAAEERIAKLQEELDEASRMMRHDQLTGMLNRRGLEEMFEAERARARRRNSTLALALLDIDNFKKLNDTFGHKVGDDALIHLTRVVRRHLRPQDVLARYGGEEFVILLPETEGADAYNALTRLQRELTREFFMNDNQKLVITFSAGVTTLGVDERLDSALERADNAMYQAKQAGRNRVVVAELKQGAV